MNERDIKELEREKNQELINQVIDMTKSSPFLLL